MKQSAYRKELLTFLYHDNVPFDNNHAERVIRDGVVKRKNSNCNRSKQGAQTQAILMSIFQTLKQKKGTPVKTLLNALKQSIRTKKLPPIPQKNENSTE
ncbi:MAG: transposase [Planctomycetaceae bacterium]|nr:transposase [Planctomycetaceae bacterium]